MSQCGQKQICFLKCICCMANSMVCYEFIYCVGIYRAKIELKTLLHKLLNPLKYIYPFRSYIILFLESFYAVELKIQYRLYKVVVIVLFKILCFVLYHNHKHPMQCMSIKISFLFHENTHKSIVTAHEISTKYSNNIFSWCAPDTNRHSNLNT